MTKYLVETFYTCTFKVNHYLDNINETELKNLEKRDDGKFEVIDVKLDNRKTKNLDPKNNKVIENKKIDPFLKEDAEALINKMSKDERDATLKVLLEKYPLLHLNLPFLQK